MMYALNFPDLAAAESISSIPFQADQFVSGSTCFPMIRPECDKETPKILDPANIEQPPKAVLYRAAADAENYSGSFVADTARSKDCEG